MYGNWIRAAGGLLLCGLLLACGRPVLDNSSDTALQTSVDRMLETLPPKRQQALKAAFGVMRERSPGAVGGQPDGARAIYAGVDAQALHALDGLNADQIIERTLSGLLSRDAAHQCAAKTDPAEEEACFERLAAPSR